MAELGALTLRIEAVGAGAVLRELAALETQAKKAGATVDQGMKGAGAALKVFDKELAASTALFALQGRTADITNKQLVAQIRQNAAAQLQWMQQVGASEVQQLRFAAAVQTFERRLQSATTTQNRARTSLLGLGRDGRSAMIGLGFAISQMASTGEASLISLARQVATITALMGGKLGIAGIIGAVGIGIFDFFRERAKVQGQIARDSATQGARDAAGIQKAQLQQDEAAQTLAFARGLTSLKQFYDARQRIIQQNLEAETRAKRAEVSALGEPISGETKKETADRLLAQKKAVAELAALDKQSLAAQIALQGERENAERQLTDTLLGFESQRLEAQGKTHEARLEQITLEAAAFRRALGPAPDADERVKKFTDAMKQQANLAQAQVDIDRLQTDLDARRLEIQNQLTAGTIDEQEASKSIADIERSALPTLQQMVDLALRFAAALGDEGAVAALKKLKIELSGLGVDLAAVAKLKSTAESLGSVIRSALEGGFARGLGQGGIGKAFKGLLAEISSGFGSIAIRVGLDALKIGRLMEPLAAALASLNPFVAIAAGIALVALGSAMGGSGAGGAGAGGGGFSGSTASSTPLSVSRLVIDPNAGVRQRMAGVGSMTAASPSGPVQVLEVIGASTPRGQEIIGTSNARYVNRRT